MCDYSLHNVRTRPAEVGDKLITHSFPTGTGLLRSRRWKRRSLSSVRDRAVIHRRRKASADVAVE